MDELNC